MGNNLNKDKDLKVCILLDNIVYNAGEVVTGRVCIRATANKPYQYLYINIIGSESVYWTEQHGKHPILSSEKPIERSLCWPSLIWE